MKTHIVIVSISFFLLSGCYMGISGRVVDAETMQPLEGAVVLAEWLETHGFGLTSHTVYKIVETETDMNGRFSLPGAYNPMVDEPYLVIYKKGYVAWRNDDIFPGYEKRKDYDVWMHGYNYKLERYKEEYSRKKHSSFMSKGIIGSSLQKTPKFEAAYGYELSTGIE